MKSQDSVMRTSLLLIFSLAFSCYTLAGIDKTKALHVEVAAQSHYNITKESHPILFDIVHRLVTRAGISMPRYITIFGAEYTITDKDGFTYRCVRGMKSYVDVMGDLYICREILKNLSYDEIEGVVAVAIAEKLINKPLKLVETGVGTFAATLTSLYYLNKKYNLNLGSLLQAHRPSCRNSYYCSCHEDREDAVKVLAAFLTIPVCTVTKVKSNYLQKRIDIDATKLTATQNVINGIMGIEKVQEMYAKESMISRIASALYLKEIWNAFIYPVRAFTAQERVAYLSELENEQV